MSYRILAVETNLYDLISSMHDQTRILDSQIPETVSYLAASGRIRWVKNKPQGIDGSKVDE
ncbi:MAG: hypothetical protein C4519_06440 [Desulfobacteraceae bacterium]|nr:MAG: hypothetical protein C4519_06440 [Desulfobacteraceae bacterium]